MIRVSLFALSLLFLPVRAQELPSSITQRPNGEIILPITAATRSTDGTLSWTYKPTRWGMYDVEVLSPGNPPTAFRVQVAGKELTAPSDATPAKNGDNEAFSPLGRFYLEKSEPFEIRAAANKNAELKAIRLRPAPEGKPIRQERDEIVLHARDATTHSVMMRYEPATNKNCLGFWTNPNDSASWTFEVTKPGTYDIEFWQGCGKGQGGSEAAVTIAELSSGKPNTLKEAQFTVEDTGHFQNFIPRNLGEVTFKTPGTYELRVQPIRKKAAAVMDIRQILLQPRAR